MRVRLVDLDDREPVCDQRPYESGRVGAGRLDPDPIDLAVPAYPADQPRLPLTCGRERGRAEQPPLHVDHGDVMLVGMRIDARHHNTPLIGHPSSHRPLGSGRQAGTSGHNSDEALAASRFLSSHDRPDRPPERPTTEHSPRPTRPINDTNPVSLKAGQISTSTPTRSSLFESRPLRSIRCRNHNDVPAIWHFLVSARRGRRCRLYEPSTCSARVRVFSQPSQIEPSTSIGEASALLLVVRKPRVDARAEQASCG